MPYMPGSFAKRGAVEGLLNTQLTLVNAKETLLQGLCDAVARLAGSWRHSFSGYLATCLYRLSPLLED